MSYDAVLAVQGNPINGSHRVTLSNAQLSLTDRGIPITKGDMKAVGVLISVETYDARILFGTANLALGHVLAVGSSGNFNGAKAVESIKIGNKTAGSNAVVEVTVFF